MDGVNNAFCMSKEEYELARLATKCSGLQGKIDDQAAEIVSLYEMNLAQAKTIKKQGELCDKLGRALDGHCAPMAGHEEEHRLALEAWRVMRCS